MNFSKMLHDPKLSDAPMPGVPLLELMGDGRVLIEHHKGVTQYDRDQICVRVRFGLLCVCGEDLCLSQMTKGQLVILGQIDCIRVLRGCD